MEDMEAQSIEDSLRKKIILYNDLLECFKEEKEALINVDLDRLWSISKEKEELCLRISAVRKQIVHDLCPEAEPASFTLNSLMMHIPESDRKSIDGLYYTLQRLKSEVDALRKENMRVADYSLRFLDEVLSIIIGKSHQAVVYNNRCRLGPSGRDMILRREV